MFNIGQLNNMDWEHVDIAAIIAGVKTNGVVAGLAVTESATPAMTVLVASGQCMVDEVDYTESSGQNLNISNGDATHPRKDIIVYDTSAGNPAVVEGTPAAAPISPDIPDGDIYLAMVHVAANETTNIVNADIDEGRVFVGAYHGHKHLEGGADEMEYYDLEYAATMHSNDTSRTVTETSYTKKKEIDIDICADTIRFYWTTYINNDTYSSNTLYSRIYVNGIAAGAAKSNSVSSGNNATVNYTEDISGLEDGDLVQIYAYRTVNDLGNPGAITCNITNFRVKGKNFKFPIPVSGFTNQDP